MDTTDEFAKPPVLLRRDFLADVTGGGIAGYWCRLVYELYEHLSHCQGVLHCSQSPSVKITQAVDVLF